MPCFRARPIKVSGIRKKNLEVCPKYNDFTFTVFGKVRYAIMSRCSPWKKTPLWVRDGQKHKLDPEKKFLNEISLCQNRGGIRQTELE